MEPTPPTTRIRCRDAEVWLGARRVLAGVDLDVEAGRIHVLVGPNGGGKTTLLRLLLGLVEPTHGRVMWTGPDGEASRRPFAMGYVPQHASLDARYPLTVADVVGWLRPGSGRRGLPAPEVAAVLERLRLQGLADRPVGELSGGQQQRVLLARALAQRAPVLVLDEPTTGLDTVGQDDLLELLRELRDREGVAVVLSTHHPGELLRIVDRGYRVAGRVEPAAPDALEEVHGSAAVGAGREPGRSG